MVWGKVGGCQPPQGKEKGPISLEESETGPANNEA
jgi:hypothetical protein